MKIVECDIEFKIPIIDIIDSTQRCEFINTTNKTLDDCRQGALVLQTCEDIFVLNLATGSWENVTMGSMRN